MLSFSHPHTHQDEAVVVVRCGFRDEHVTCPSRDVDAPQSTLALVGDKTV
uniref:Uncharacterized protein n=1 Tax=Kalanchoe fedtschenkoi TaxID=63787 RepID=A0A7N0U9A5_KALFE